MIYRQWLVMRKALVWYAGISAAGAIFTLGTIAMGSSRICGTQTTLSGWALTSGYTAMIFAAIYGSGLGNASREGARVFWVLPQGRLRTSLGLLGVDLAGVLVALAITFLGSALFFSIAIPMEGSHCRIIADLSVPNVALALGFPLAVYGWSALTGMLLRRVAYMGIVFMPVGFLWYGFAHADNVLGAALGSIGFANPYIMVNHGGVWQMWTIVLVTLAVAVALWQRAEVVA